MKKILLILFLSISLCLSLFLYSSKFNQVSFIAVGDNIIHEKVFTFAKENNTYNFKPCYKHLKKYISNHDLAYINQETLIAGDQYGIKGYPNFNSPEALINDLQDTGFNMVSGATNHSLDLGKDALLSSVKIWKQHPKILFSGLYENQDDRQTIRVIEKNGLRFSFLSYTFGVNETSNYQTIQAQLKASPYLLGQLDKNQIKEDIKSAKKQSDVIIVAVHWGKENNISLSPLQKEYAQYFANLGVDVVIGNHPHLIQPIEKIKNTLIIYSLGNFLSTMKGVYNQLEGMISFNFIKKKKKVTIENITYIPLINHYNDDIVTIYPLKEYSSTLANQHSILKNHTGIIKEFKNYIKQLITTDDIDIEM